MTRDALLGMSLLLIGGGLAYAALFRRWGYYAGPRWI
jgi:hypothetical protein